MKIRTGFVSNSSSSSFICSVPNYKGASLDERVKLEELNDRLSDAIKYDEEDEIASYKEELAKWMKYAEENDECVFDLRLEYGFGDTLEKLCDRVPGLKILEYGE